MITKNILDHNWASQGVSCRETNLEKCLLYCFSSDRVELQWLPASLLIPLCTAGYPDRRPGRHLLHPAERGEPAGAAGRRQGCLHLRDARRVEPDAAGAVLPPGASPHGGHQHRQPGAAPHPRLAGAH